MNCLNNELNTRTIVLLLFNEIFCIDSLMEYWTVVLLSNRNHDTSDDQVLKIGRSTIIRFFCLCKSKKI